MRGLIKLGLAFVGGWAVARIFEAHQSGIPLSPALLTQWDKSVRSMQTVRDTNGKLIEAEIVVR